VRTEREHGNVMFFEWNEQTLRWLLDASEYTGYNKNLAKLLLKYLEPGETMCDMGCGMGLIDFELSPSLEHITCVDQVPFAVSFIEKESKRRGIDNITALCGDALEMQGEWDTVIALFHGTVETTCVPYFTKAKKQLIIVTHGENGGRTGPEGYRVRRCTGVNTVAAWLAENGFSYEFEEGMLEFGQPHRNFEDAVNYTRTFCQNPPEELLLKHVRENITETGRDDFPLYTPKTRKFGIFIIRKADNKSLV